MSTNSRPSWSVAGITLALGVAALVAAGAWHDLAPPGSPRVAAPVWSGRTVLRLAQFEHAAVGARLADVLSITGAPSARIADESIGGERLLVLSWENEDSSNALMVFRGVASEPEAALRLVHKVRVGLR